MKKFFMILGVIFCVLFVILASTLGYSFYVGAGQDASSKAYVNLTIPKIVSHWDTCPQEILDAAGDELKYRLTIDKIS